MDHDVFHHDTAHHADHHHDALDHDANHHDAHHHAAHHHDAHHHDAHHIRAHPTHFDASDYGTITSDVHLGEHRRLLILRWTGPIIFAGVVLIFCGLLGLFGIIPGGSVSIGIPLLVFGAVMTFAGTMPMIIIPRVAMRQQRTVKREQKGNEVVCAPPEQLANIAFFNQLSGDGERINAANDQIPGDAQPHWHSPLSAPLPASAPPPYSEVATTYSGQASEASSKLTACP